MRNRRASSTPRRNRDVVRTGGTPLLLDGATGTELERRGVQTSMPLWTALAAREVPQVLRAIHDDYVGAGADVITACTFRTTPHTLAKSGLDTEARALTREAVLIARDAARAAAPRDVLVAGCIAPLEDCYQPELTPEDRVLARVHEAHVNALVDAGVDLLLVETMPTLREAEAAACIAIRTNLPVWVSLLAGPSATLYDGQPLADAVPTLLGQPIELIAVNCGSAAWCTEALGTLADSDRPFGVYANSGEPDGTFGRAPQSAEVEHYASFARVWLESGAQMIGGCCGTGPDHIARLRTLIDEASAKRDLEPPTGGGSDQRKRRGRSPVIGPGPAGEGA